MILQLCLELAEVRAKLAFIKHSLSHLTDVLVAFKSRVMLPWILAGFSPSLGR